MITERYRVAYTTQGRTHYTGEFRTKAAAESAARRLRLSCSVVNVERVPARIA